LFYLIRYRETGEVERKDGSRGKRKTSERDDNAIVRLAKRQRFITRKEIKETLHLNVSKITIGRRLNEQGLFNYLTYIKN
jgi:predicted HTH transcriptional regulator